MGIGIIARVAREGCGLPTMATRSDLLDWFGSVSFGRYSTAALQAAHAALHEDNPDTWCRECTDWVETDHHTTHGGKIGHETCQRCGSEDLRRGGAC